MVGTVGTVSMVGIDRTVCMAGMVGMVGTVATVSMVGMVGTVGTVGMVGGNVREDIQSERTAVNILITGYEPPVSYMVCGVLCCTVLYCTEVVLFCFSFRGNLTLESY